MRQRGTIVKLALLKDGRRQYLAADTRRKENSAFAAWAEPARYAIMFRSPDGRQKKEGGFDTKRAAAGVLAKRIAALHDGTYREIVPVTLREYAGKWLAAQRGHLKPSTYRSYESGLGVYLDPAPKETKRRARGRAAHQLVRVWGERPLASLTVSDVNAYLAGHAARLRPATLRNTLALLTKLLSDAVEDGNLVRNPLRGSRALRRPRAIRAGDEREVEILAPAEIGRVLDALDPAWQPLFLTAASTGLRLGELLALQWGDLDWAAKRLYVRRTVHRGAFYVPKSRRSRRTVDLGDQLLAVLSRRRREAFGEADSPAEALVFPSSAGGPINPDNLRNRVWAPALAKAKLRHVRIHSLRHSYASLLIQNGENIKYVSAQLGHASAAFTLDVYSHVIPDGKRAAATRLETAFAEAREAAAEARG